MTAHADTIREALGLSRSIALCGEHFGRQAEDAHDAALAALAALERRVQQLEQALKTINWLLTTAEGDNIPRGEAPKIAVREHARAVLAGGEETPA